MACVPPMPCYQNPVSEGVIINTVYPEGCTPKCNPTSSDCIIYTGPNLPNSLINTKDDITLALEKIDSKLLTTSGVPTSRVLTINGTSYDLSADRTWSVGTVTSVGMTAGTGISISGSTVTSAGSFTVTNTAPDQIVTLTAGSNITITGTYPNFTISSTGGGSTYTASNGITLSGSNFILGGSLTGNTTIPIGSFDLNFTTSSNANLQISNTNGLRLLGLLQSLVFNGGFTTFTDSNPGTKQGLLYAANGYVSQPQSLADKQYCDEHLKGYTFSNSPSSGQAPVFDGTNITWTTVSGGGTPAGADTQVQFNNSGSFGASSHFTWLDSQRALTVDSQGISGTGYCSFTNYPNAGSHIFVNTSGGTKTGYYIQANVMYIGAKNVDNLTGDIAIYTYLTVFNNGIGLKVSTPTQLTTNTNNYSLTNESFFRISASTPINITGIDSSGLSSANKLIVFRNIGTNTITFTNEDVNSSATNRITTSTGANITLNQNQSLTLIYDSTSQRWFDIAYR